MSEKFYDALKKKLRNRINQPKATAASTIRPLMASVKGRIKGSRIAVLKPPKI
jgi:hypothetical protein